MSERELTDLCGKVRDDSITAEETVRLEALLRDDPEARSHYLRFLQLDALLERFAPTEEPLGAVESVGFSLWRNRVAIGWLAAAASVILLAAGWFVYSLTRSGVADDLEWVATLVLTEDCQWNGNRPSEGQRIDTGPLELVSGTAVLRFDGGAEVVLAGPVGLTVMGPAVASLAYGSVVVRAEDGAEGFRLSTPRGELIDLGTEFAVRVEGNGDTELHVHEGEVAVGGGVEFQPENVIKEGHAVKIRPGSGGFDRVALGAPRFRELLARAGPKEQRDLMTAYEGFHTDPGVYTPGDLDLGKGWAGPWRQRRPGEMRGHLKMAAGMMTIAHSRMDVTWPIKGGKAGMLEMPPGASVWLRRMNEPIRTKSGEIRYFSFLVTEPKLEVGRKRDGKLERNDLRFTFRSSAEYFGESLSIGWGEGQQPRVSIDHGVAAKSVRRIPEDSTVFCVAKIMTRQTGGDRVHFRFYTDGEELDLIEPAEWDITLSGLDLSCNLDLIVLTSNSAETRYVDEIRLGPSWRSVTPVNTPLLLTRVGFPKDDE